jgi:hypothetical protein
MDEAELENLLRLRRVNHLPPAPANLAQNVWREIRRRRAAGEGGWLAWFIEPFCRWSLVVPALALAILLGAGLAVKTVEAQPSPARMALDLQVFSPTPPSLPSTLLHAGL